MRQLIRVTAYGLSAAAVAILVLAGATARPSNPSLWPPKPGEPEAEIFVVSHGYHSGIAISTAALAAAAQRNGYPALGLVAERFGGHPFVEFGWGERDFYASVPTVADLHRSGLRRELSSVRTTSPSSMSSDCRIRRARCSLRRTSSASR
jgi:hypothetical protein